jgi:hypothetical protein
MAKRIVCLTFDFDAVSGWVSRAMTTPTPMSRGEFGLIGADPCLPAFAHELPMSLPGLEPIVQPLQWE